MNTDVSAVEDGRASFRLPETAANALRDAAQKTDMTIVACHLKVLEIGLPIFLAAHEQMRAQINKAITAADSRKFKAAQ